MDLLLQTKLHVPPHRPSQWIVRPRLTRRLDDGLRRKLTVISAPAGFGKTTLVTGWLHSSERPVVWLTLDESEDESLLFLRYLIAALQRAVPNLGEDLLRSLQSAPAPPMQMILTGIINEPAPAQPLILVLDDYHLVENPEIDQGMSFFIEHMPPALHIILTSRSAPNLPLSRLRVEGELVEIRAEELRFTHQEAADFLRQTLSLPLTEEIITALETRTEGWIAGLQMAAISMQGSRDVAAFVDSFTGSHRYVMDYLTDEVLNRESAEIRTFLLRTSILDRLSGDLCDALLAPLQENDPQRLWPSQAILEELARRNLFLIPMDNQNGWFRYHHLFADLLRRRLYQLNDEVAALHHRASEWHLRAGSSEEALHHALAAGDMQRAADLLEQKVSEALRYGRVQWTADRLKALPTEEIQQRPDLLMAQAWVHYFRQQSDQITQPLNQLEALAQTLAGDEVRKNQIYGQASLLHAWALYDQGELEKGVELLQRALRLLPESDANYRGLAYLFLGNVLDRQGKLDEAVQSLEQGAKATLQADNIAAHLGVQAMLSGIDRRLGHLSRAKARLEQVLRWAEREELHYLPSMAELHVQLASVSYEQNDLAAVEHHLSIAQNRSQRGLISTTIIPLIERFLTFLYIAQERWDDARHALERAVAQIEQWPHSNARQNAYVDLARANVYLAELSAAEAWRREAGLNVVGRSAARNWHARLDQAHEIFHVAGHQCLYAALAAALCSRSTALGLSGG
jgi:LuxR family transcriptional regulator, maltose regulon positive regulatory protein